jgi:hypothetical protein
MPEERPVSRHHRQLQATTGITGSYRQLLTAADNNRKMQVSTCIYRTAKGRQITC